MELELVAIRWQNQIHIILISEFDLAIFKKLMKFDIIIKAPLFESGVWTFVIPQEGLPWFNDKKADLSKGVDSKIFKYIASGDIEAVCYLSINQIIMEKINVENAKFNQSKVDSDEQGKFTISKSVREERFG